MSRSDNFRVINRVIGFLESVLMGCFFSCFRVKDDRWRKAKPISSEDKESLVPKQQLDSVFVSEVLEENGSPLRRISYPSLQDSVNGSISQSELKQEAKFLKSCGALLETPPEIRRTSDKIVSQISKKRRWDEQCELGDGNQAKQNNNTSRTSEKEIQSSERHQTRVESWQFEGMKQKPGVESGQEFVILDISPSHNDNKIPPRHCDDSPYPTPLNLTEEMQTPGTVYPLNMENHGTRKRTRIRTQYVYPVLKPVENLPPWRGPIQESCRPVQSINPSELLLKSSRRGSREKKQAILLTPGPKNSNLLNSSSFLYPNDKSNLEQNFIPKEDSLWIPNNLADDAEQLNPNTPVLVAPNFSQWTKPPTPKEEREDTEIAPRGQVQYDKSFDADRPIIGIVGTYWDNSEHPHVFPKQWDGNGIPNTTKKYKEVLLFFLFHGLFFILVERSVPTLSNYQDQKVSWHATPFEERLEKVLSDEKCLAHRKLLYRRPADFEGAESDTPEA